MKVYNSSQLGSNTLSGSLDITGSLQISSGLTGSVLGTSSYSDKATLAITANTASFATGYVLTSATSSMTVVSASRAVSASNADLLDNLNSTAFVLNSQTSSMAVLSANTASFIAGYVLTSATSSMSVVSASRALSASNSDLLDNLDSTAFVLNSQTSSMTVNSASFAINASSSLWAVSASRAITASFALNSGGGGVSLVGATNYIPKITGANALSQSIISDSGNTVLITSPNDSVPLTVKSTLTGNVSSIGFQGSSSANTFNVRLGANVEDMVFYTNNTERMRISGSGNVGIGTISPASLLDVSSPNPTITLTRNDNGSTPAGAINFSATSTVKWQIGTNKAVGPGLEFNTGNSTGNVMYISSSGNVGISTITPSSKLDVNGDTTITGSLNNGYLNISNGLNSHAEGYTTRASGQTSHAEGTNTFASGTYSHAEGAYATASGQSSHAEGSYSNSIGYASHAEGSAAYSYGYASHAEGDLTTAMGDNSHAEGSGSITYGTSSHAEGWGTIASASYQHVQGQYNIKSTIQSAFIHGNGVSDANRSNLINAHDSVVEISGSIAYSLPTSSASTSGEIVYFGTGTGLTAGNLYYLNTSAVWTACNAGAASTSTGMLAIALGTTAANGMLVRGMARFGTSFYTAATTGQILYASASAGGFGGTAPTGTTQVVRVIGYCITGGSTIYFTPDNTWVTLV